MKGHCHEGGFCESRFHERGGSVKGDFVKGGFP